MEQLGPVNWIKDWSGAIATGFAAIIGLIGIFFAPRWAKKQNNERSDTALAFDAGVKDRANLVQGFNDLLKTQQSRIDQLAKQLDDSLTDRAQLWQQIRNLSMEVSACEEARMQMERKHAEEISSLKDDLAIYQRELAEFRNRDSGL